MGKILLNSSLSLVFGLLVFLFVAKFITGINDSAIASSVSTKSQSEFYEVQRCDSFRERLKVLEAKMFNSAQASMYKSEIIDDAIRNQCRDNLFALDEISRFKKQILDDEKCDDLKLAIESDFSKHTRLTTEFFKDRVNILKLAEKSGCLYKP